MAAKSKSPRSPLPAYAGLVAAALLAVGWFFWRADPPQLGDNERVFSAVDALFTAVTARNEKLLAECEGRLSKLRENGALNAETADYIDGIVSQAKQGQWQAAARRLYKFMQAQRREAVGERDV